MAKLYICKVCGEPYLGEDAPDDCPFCGAPLNYMKSVEEFKPLWEIELTEQEKSDMKDTLDLEVNATAYYNKVSKANEKYSKMNRLFKQLARVEEEHAEVAAKFLGVDEPELKGEDPKGSVKEDLERTRALEAEATTKYKNFLANAENKEVKNFYVALIHAEQSHHDFVDAELE